MVTIIKYYQIYYFNLLNKYSIADLNLNIYKILNYSFYSYKHFDNFIVKNKIKNLIL